jgi:hypothetical protein
MAISATVRALNARAAAALAARNLPAAEAALREAGAVLGSASAALDEASAFALAATTLNSWGIVALSGAGDAPGALGFFMEAFRREARAAALAPGAVPLATHAQTLLNCGVVLSRLARHREAVD